MVSWSLALEMLPLYVRNFAESSYNDRTIYWGGHR
jgi:hypothetical protein